MLKYIGVLLSLLTLAACGPDWEKAAEGSYRSYGFRKNGNYIHPTGQFKLELKPDHSCSFLVDGQTLKGNWELQENPHENNIIFTVGAHILKSKLMVQDEDTCIIYIENDGLLGGEADEVSFISI